MTTLISDPLYESLVNLLHEIKIVQGIPAVSATLRRHDSIRKFLISKQISMLSDLESKLP